MIKTKNLALKLAILYLVVFISSCAKNTKDNSESFSFVFLTDIHLQPELNATKGFKQAIDSINKYNPDFCITGGDLIMDALGQSYTRSDSLFNLYLETVKGITSPVYNTMGNHDIYGIYTKSKADPSNPEYGEKMFENRIGKSYYSFEYKGWKFFVINSVEDTKKSRYIGLIDDQQIGWLKDELSKTDPKTPLVITTHIPFITAFKQKYYGSTLGNDSTLVVYNSKEVIDLFKGHNLKLVLQGHLHTIEDIYIDGVHFITGGSICGKWWNGANMDFEEGFMYFTVNGENFDWKYIDYGWVADSQ